MELCTTLQLRVLGLKTTKTTQAIEITSLKRRVKKLEGRNKLRTHRVKRLYKVGSSRRVESSKEEGLGEEDASKQGRIVDIDAYAGLLAEDTRSVLKKLPSFTILVSSAITTTITTAITNVEMTLAQALVELKSAKPKADKVVIQEPEQGTRVRRQGKGKMVEPEPVKKMSKKDLLRLDEELAFKLQAEEEDEEERLAKEKAQQVKEANIAWDRSQAKIMLDLIFGLKTASLRAR
ncbi:hypothetical protein Tco_0272705 [Tanacetum coccineum]